MSGRRLCACMAASPPRQGSLAVKLPSEPVLDGVHEDDRTTVRNVIYVMHALKLCQSWSVSPKNQGYEVVGTVASQAGFIEIELRDMELVRRVDPLRVSTVSVRMLGTTPSLVVYVLRRSEPVVLEEQEIVHIQRKRKFWLGGSG